MVEDLDPFNPNRLNLTSTVFERFHGGPNRWLARRLASRLAADQDPTKFSQDPYVHLENYYDSSGEPYEARSIYYEGRCAVRENAKAYRRAYLGGKVLWPWGRIWFTDFGLKWMTGYGVKARRCVLPLMLLVVVGTIVFWPNNALRPTPSTTPSGTPTNAVASSDLDRPGAKPEAGSLAAHAWERFSYSADLALPTVSFQGVSILEAGAANKLVPQGSWREMYAAVHQVLGQLLILLFVATVLGFARRW
jgi:hypothetical protein